MKRIPLVFEWLSSYLLILLVPVIITGAVYFQTTAVIEKEINNSNSFFLNKVRQHMDATLQEVERVGIEVALNSRVQNLIDVKPPIPDRSYFDIYKTAQDLKMFLVANNSVEDFFVVFLKPELVLGAGTALNTRAYFEQYANNLDLSFRDWVGMVGGSYKSKYLAVPLKNSPGENKHALFYVCSLPIIHEEKAAANVIVKVNTDRFFTDTTGVETVNNGTIFILNKQNQILASSGPAELGKSIRYEQMPLRTGIFYTRLNGEKVAVSYTASQKAEWRFVSLIPARVFREKAVYVRNLMISGLLLCLALGGILSSYFVVRNYNPVRGIIRSFEEMLKLSFDRKHNEYSFIQQAIHRTVNEKAEINSRLAQQNQVLRSVFLSRLLAKGPIGEVPVADLLEKYEIRFSSDYFLVVAFFVEGIGSHGSKEYSDPETMFQFSKNAIAKYLGEAISPQHRIWMVEINELPVCLVNLDPEGLADWKEHFHGVALEVQRLLSEMHRIDVTVAIGGVSEGISGIPQAYREALAVLEYKRVMGNSRLLFYDQINRLPGDGYYYPLEVEHQLIQCMKAGEADAAGRLVNKVFAANFETNMMSLEIARCLMYDLVSTMIKTVHEINNTERKEFLDGLNPVGALLECRSVQQMKSKIMEILREVSAFIAENSKHASYRIRDLVCSYIHEHFQDPNLNIANIAGVLGMNPEYVSKAFKEQTGEGLLDFINSYRIKQAKQLMNDENCSLDDIALKVGYTNTRTFARAFKKSEGTTPGKYKTVEKIPQSGSSH